MKNKTKNEVKQAIATAVLVRLPNSHRGYDGVARCLGYAPHEWYRFTAEGHFAYLPPGDAQKLVEAGRVTIPKRIDVRELHSCWNTEDPFRHTLPKDQTCEHLKQRQAMVGSTMDPPRAYCCECGKWL